MEKQKTELKQSKKEYYERDKFNILAKAKQQLRECEIHNCQNKGGESHITRHNRTCKNINNVKKKDYDILSYDIFHVLLKNTTKQNDSTKYYIYTRN